MAKPTACMQPNQSHALLLAAARAAPAATAAASTAVKPSTTSAAATAAAITQQVDNIPSRANRSANKRQPAARIFSSLFAPPLRPGCRRRRAAHRLPFLGQLPDPGWFSTLRIGK